MSDQATQGPVIEPAAIDRLREWGGDKLVREMIRLYLENASVRLGQIDEGLADGGDIALTEQGAHSLKSSSANVGATRVNRLAARIEEQASSGDRAGPSELRPLLGSALAEAEGALRTLVEGLPT